MTDFAPTPTSGPVGASDLGGFDTSAMASARAEIESLKVDKDFGKLLLTKVEHGAIAAPEVLQAKQRWSDLHKKAFPPTTEIRTQADVNAQAQQRHAETWNSYIAVVRRDVPDLSDAEEAEIRGGVIPKDKWQFAVNEKDRLLKDPDFVRRHKAREGAALMQYRRLQLMIALRPI